MALGVALLAHLSYAIGLQWTCHDMPKILAPDSARLMSMPMTLACMPMGMPMAITMAIAMALLCHILYALGLHWACPSL